MHGIEQQFLALQKGFNELIPQCLLKSFDERELELVIGGLGKIDLEDWRSNTRLKHCQPDTIQVQSSLLSSLSLSLASLASLSLLLLF